MKLSKLLAFTFLVILFSNLVFADVVEIPSEYENLRVYLDQDKGVYYSNDTEGNIQILRVVQDKDEQPKQSQGFTFPIALAVVAVLAFLGFIIYLSYKFESKDDKTKIRDPIFTGLMVLLVFLAISLILEGIDAVPKGWTKEHAWLFIGVFGLSIYWVMQRNKKFKPLSLEELEGKLWKLVRRRFKCGPHVGDGFGSPIPFHCVVESKGGGVFTKIIYYLVRINLTGGQFVLLGLDLGTGYIVKCNQDPDSNYVKRLFGREASQHYDFERALLSQEVTGDNGTQENNSQEN